MSSKRSITGLTKTEVKKMVNFTLHHLPQLDTPTLETFLQRVNVNYTKDLISPSELAHQVHCTRRFMPEACPYSLEVLMDLLDVQMKNPRATTSLLALGVFASENRTPSHAM